MFKKFQKLVLIPTLISFWIHRRIRPWQWGNFHPHKNPKTRTVQIRLYREQPKLVENCNSLQSCPLVSVLGKNPYSAGLLISKSVTEFEGRVLICEL